MGDDQRIIVFANTKRQVGEGRVDAWNCWTAFGLSAVQLCLLPPRLTFNFLAACPTCHTPRALQCDLVARQLEQMDYRVTMLHGGKSQDQREESIKVGGWVGGWVGGGVGGWGGGPWGREDGPGAAAPPLGQRVQGWGWAALLPAWLPMPLCSLPKHAVRPA
jgi:hypothetical protein